MTATVRLDQLPEGFRDFAEEWIGPDVDLWRRDSDNRDWSVYDGSFHGGDYIDHLPLHTRAGYLLGLDYLAHRVSVPSTARAVWLEQALALRKCLLALPEVTP